MSNQRFYLNCPYDEKDECKSLDWWDNEARKWYVPNDVDIETCSNSGGLKTPTSSI